MECILILTLQSYQQALHVVQQVMSGESTLILCSAILAFKMFMTRWESIIDKHLLLKWFIQPGLDWAYMYSIMIEWTTLKHILLLCVSKFIS
jgi:hypothetical protein